MDVSDIDDLKAQKANAIRRYRRLRTVKKLFRAVELCLFLVLLCYISARFPFAVEIAGEYVRRLFSIVASPTFVFLLTNVITLALYVMSGGNPAGDDGDTELELRSENKSLLSRDTEEITCEVVTSIDTPYTRENDEILTIVTNTDSVTEIKQPCWRSTELEKSDECRRQAETDKFERTVKEEEEIKFECEDKSGIEDLHRRVEAFIQEQVMFHRYELAAVVYEED